MLAVLNRGTTTTCRKPGCRHTIINVSFSESKQTEARVNTMLAWQTELNVCEAGKWTKRLIPRLTPWIDRKRGRVNYHLTQFLHRMRKRPDPKCLYGAARDDAQHTFFECVK